jgi:hypothetical protein
LPGYFAFDRKELDGSSVSDDLGNIMRKRLISFGCWLAGIVLVASLYIGVALAGCKWLVIVAIILASLDSLHARVWRYKSDIALSPGKLLILMLLLGWLVLPWYLGLRFKILAGTAELKDEYQWADPRTKIPDHAYPVSESGLFQPWKRK